MQRHLLPEMVTKYANCFTEKKKSTIEYPNTPSALRPVSHSEELPIPEPPTDFSISSDEEDLDVSHNYPQASMSACGGSKHDDDFSCFNEISSPHKITSIELNDLVRDLDTVRKQSGDIGLKTSMVEPSGRKGRSDFISHTSSALRIFL
ncbi:hypothetical protein AVEN_246439-1 [Araneus ventricosus]|uniref:Uncharacterized protein n=1 Tax=Araneus ventricosus TaxID=182803 RepID=A0A4Y2X9V2_ARAVE|nr:hypothetical protein AVEN_246439-1 [Araneus ventricosus]